MYRVVVADDESIIREGFCKAIPWDTLGLSLVGQAADGIEAWELIRQHQPDIIITDIRMPHMDGIELVRKLRAQGCDTQVIILSGYGEFEYAQTSVKLGVSDYIMKPIDVPAMCRTLRTCKEALDVTYHHEAEIEEMRRRLQEENQISLHGKILRYVHRRISEEQLFEDMPPVIRKCAFCACFLVQLDHFGRITGSMPAEDIFRMTQEFEAILIEQGDRDGMQIMEDVDGRYLVLFYGTSQADIAFAMRSYIRRLRMNVTGQEYTTATSAVVEGLSFCADAYEQALRTLDRAFLLGTNTDVELEQASVDAERIPELFDVRRIVKTISTFDKAAIAREFQLIEEDIRQTNHNSFLYTRMMVSFVYGEMMRLLADIHCPIQEIMDDPTAAYKRILTCQTLSGMMQQLYEFIVTICDFLDNSSGCNDTIVERARIYIDEHFSKSSMTLDEVAGVIGMSPNYFSALFKQVVGRSFINYLTDLRLSHAKRLLDAGGQRSYEVSYCCGYENPTYFSTIFKRHVGVSPSEYRARKKELPL